MQGGIRFVLRSGGRPADVTAINWSETITITAQSVGRLGKDNHEIIAIPVRGRHVA